MKFCDGGWDKISSERISEILVVLEQIYKNMASNRQLHAWIVMRLFPLGET